MLTLWAIKPSLVILSVVMLNVSFFAVGIDVLLSVIMPNGVMPGVAIPNVVMPSVAAWDNLTTTHGRPAM